MGDRLEYVRRALGMMDALPDTEFVAVSSVYDTVPVGAAGQPRFLNAVAELSTDVGPVELLRKLLAIEASCGRVRTSVWGPRTLDLDLLLYDDVEIETEELTLPHPRARGRAFVLVPLAELAPDLSRTSSSPATRRPCTSVWRRWATSPAACGASVAHRAPRRGGGARPERYGPTSTAQDVAGRRRTERDIDRISGGNVPKKNYVAIEGVIGAGKTTLATLLAKEWGAHLKLEVVCLRLRIR
jgi:2-amino-4-hydroxy-6-hydroxymethyldihydropteridine diphosphokinase